ncbi:hypothetical protein BO78DRAFT_76396 [Aspergillus sclerotiicarbonarius CBS 121057]|uniref:Heterokaryon incompatibility domain-containing protein n=1 Tax=Aspergillus sclerotiicarbonarius (strain CBS 121057 / IBT 28362) TaxID=1448318 RepID=A0A319EFZ8_ASPSB|nr:hypothetical protein BO78DRAFT_76396 [Aspergillus sclerotiicarbonarius CBS 121057]
MDGYSQSRHIARQHIEKIGAQYARILENDLTQKMIDQVLQFFGEDIYSSSTHFLLELIQNADDNQYADDITPTLALSYRNRLLRTDCNELGFTPDQVDSICRLGFSTKKYQAGSTGEKGVGFKSVFGVAASVWIASRAYTFKFDPFSQAGMLVPIWEDPPDATRPEHTSMYLRLLPQTDETNVFHDLDLIGSKVLTFLRKLRELQLHIELQAGTRVSYNVTRQDLRSADGLQMTQLTFTGAKYPARQQKAYVVCRYEIRGMPEEKKRPGHTDSELQLAFPVDDSGQPVLESQDVYSVLPVRSYGFTFLLQGDFLLSTSREEISSSKEWNHKLCQTLPDAFTAAVQEIVAHRRDFPWFRFLPDMGFEKSFFQQVKDLIPSRVAKEQVLLSEGMDENGLSLLALPGLLRYIPAQFRDSDGYSLTLSARTRDRYVSMRYSHEDWRFFQRLGVKQMSPVEFMEDLGHLVNNHGVQNKPVQWHECLARAVNKLLHNGDSKRFRDLLCKLAILPLRDNQWVSSADGIVFLPPIPASVPGGLKIFEISPASVDSGLKSDRAIFFEYAGAQGYNPTVVCDKIVERQTVWARSWQDSRGPQRRLGDSRVSELANQLYFLFRNKWTSDGTRTLWVLNERREPCQASSVYIPSNEPGSAAIMLQGMSPKVELLHKDYLSVGGGDKLEFIEWLRSTFGIWRIPRLATAGNDLSPDFQYVIDTASSMDWLRLLDKDFDQYSDWLVTASRKSRNVLTSLRTTLVDCATGEKAMLGETCRPGLERFLERRCLALDPEFGNWSLLASLGVIVGMDLKFYFSQLVQLKGTEPSEEKIRHLYADIEAKSKGGRNKDLIRSTFIQDGLIYAPSSKSKTGYSWLQPDDCIWKGPKSLKYTPKLQELYPENVLLFKNILKIRNAGPELVLREIDEYKLEEPNDVLERLQDANDLWKDVNPYTLGLIKRLKIFPVRQPSQLDGFVLMGESDAWLIPDDRQRKYFCHDLPLLAFNYDEFDSMPKIRGVFGLGARKLEATKEVFCEDQNPQLLSLKTGTFLDRIRLMSRLIPRGAPNMRDRMERLYTAQLYSVDEIFWALTVRYGDQVITRGKGIAECLLTDDEEGLKIKVSRNCIKYDMFPSELADGLCRLYKISERALAQDALTRVLAYVEEKFNNSGYTADMEHQLPAGLPGRWSGERVPTRANVRTSSKPSRGIRGGDRDQEASLGPKGRDRTTSSKLPAVDKHATARAILQEESIPSPSAGAEAYAVLQNIHPNAAISTPDQTPQASHLSEGGSRVHEEASDPEIKADMEAIEAHRMSVPKSGQVNQQQTSQPESLGDLLLSLNQDLGSDDLKVRRFHGGMDEHDIALMYHADIDVEEVVQHLDIPIRKQQTGHAELIANTRLGQTPTPPVRQSSDSNPREGERPNAPHSHDHTPQKLAPSQGQVNEVDLASRRTLHHQMRGVDNSHSYGQLFPPVFRVSTGPVVLQVPGFPQGALLDFLHNRVRRKAPVESAQIIFLTSDADSPGTHDGVIIDPGTKTLPGRVHLDGKKGPRTVFVTSPDSSHQEATCSGELVVSRLLKTALGGFYAPESHWTSPWRVRAGYDSFTRQDGPNVPHTAFILPNCSPLTDFLVRHGCDRARKWTNKSVTYYLDVQVTSGDLNAPFRVHQKNFQMARAASMNEAESGQVYILIRLYNIYACPEIAIFVNIWNLYTTGKLDLTVTGDHYVATLTDALTDTPRFSLVDNDGAGQYKFRRLASPTHIRLLRLSSQKGDTLLHGTISHISLDAKPCFTALSYTWGPALKPYCIRTAEGDVPITASLYYALTRIQRTEGSIDIWADGISINQSDATEKSQQIRLLPTIYRQATQVFGWVGDEANNSGTAMKALRDIVVSPSVISRLGKNVWGAIIEFFARPWFVRSWIIQEVILARDLHVVCGSEKLPWEKLYSAVQACEKYAASSMKDLKIPATRNLGPILSLGKTRRMYQKKERYELLELFELFQHAKSTLRRDRLFTLLNIAADADGFNTDYGSPLESIVCEYASKFVGRGKALDLLSRARGVSPSRRFPSWIPDWTANRYPKTISLWPSERGFCAAGDSEPDISVDPDNKAILLAAGVTVDSIVKVGSCPCQVDKAMDYIRDILEFIDLYTKEAREELEFRIPIGDAANGGWGDRNGLERSFRLIRPSLSRKNTPPPQVAGDPKTLSQDLWLYRRTAVEFSEWLGTAVVCQTERGFIGLVPAGAKEGDAIALISGGKVPFCLRSDQGSGMYQLVGEAYIHGMMHGEAFHAEDVKILHIG